MLLDPYTTIYLDFQVRCYWIHSNIELLVEYKFISNSGVLGQNLEDSRTKHFNTRRTTLGKRLNPSERKHENFYVL